LNTWILISVSDYRTEIDITQIDMSARASEITPEVQSAIDYIMAELACAKFDIMNGARQLAQLHNSKLDIVNAASALCRLHNSKLESVIAVAQTEDSL
jgi:hypothetical protein